MHRALSIINDAADRAGLGADYDVWEALRDLAPFVDHGALSWFWDSTCIPNDIGRQQNLNAARNMIVRQVDQRSRSRR